jgi:hypothetical protein
MSWDVLIVNTTVPIDIEKERGLDFSSRKATAAMPHS